LQYYESGWKDAVNNNDGTFKVNTTAKTVSLRMTYAYGTMDMSNVTVGSDTVVFKTVAANVQLTDSKGSAIDTGTVQYYAGGWKDFGTTTNGVATKELLPNTYTFRMTYASASVDKQQNLSTSATVVFQTVAANVQLQNSTGTLMDQGTVQYYAGGWKDFGTTINGVALKELLPNSYTFRMTYASASVDKQQNLSTSTTVVFQTVAANVQLQNSAGTLMDQGTVQYYAGGWKNFGTTTNGVATKELLPNSYTFRMTYASASLDKQQNLSTSTTVTYSTVLATINVVDTTGQLVSGATVSYYASGWKEIGSTVNGVTTTELLPVTLTFRVSYKGKTKDKVFNLSKSGSVNFSVE
jgi:hypothetical protein